MVIIAPIIPLIFFSFLRISYRCRNPWQCHFDKTLSQRNISFNLKVYVSVTRSVVNRKADGSNPSGDVIPSCWLQKWTYLLSLTALSWTNKTVKKFPLTQCWNEKKTTIIQSILWNTHLDKGKRDTSHTQYRFTKNMTFYPHTLSWAQLRDEKMPQKISTHVSARTKWYDNST